MVTRVKKFDLPPTGLLNPKWDSLKADALVTKNDHVANSKCYRDETLDTLIKIYNHKCSACERERGFELQVDHFRPRKERNNDTSNEYNQPGYYWLTYEWSNLIPLCSKCNNAKSNKFPITGVRISDHTNINGDSPFEPYSLIWLQSVEKPLLINPECDSNIENNFIFSKDAKIRGRTLSGEESIKIYDLNRKDLLRERLKVKQEYIVHINNILSEFGQTHNLDILKGGLKVIFTMIVNRVDVNSPYSMFHLYLVKYFDYHIGSKLLPNLRHIVVKYFNQFKSSNGI